MDLYTRLYNQRPTEKKDNLENFLTEAVTDALNRMNGDEQRRIWQALLPEHKPTIDRIFWPLRWRSQVTIYHRRTYAKYADVIGFEGAAPTILVENKISAGLTSHQDEHPDNGNSEWLNQLHVYGQWLNQGNPEGLLVLLTKDTPPPEGFQSNSRTAKDFGAPLTWFEPIFR